MLQRIQSVVVSIAGYALVLIGFAPILSVLFALALWSASPDAPSARPLSVRDFAILISWLAVAPSIGLFVLRLGARLVDRGRKMRTEDGWALLALDPRPPVLYLRSFDDDGGLNAHVDKSVSDAGLVGVLLHWLVGSVPGMRRTQEEELVQTLSTLGPCIAVADPREKYPSLGAARIWLGSDWQAQVADLMHRARLIVFRVGSNSSGFWWEVNRARGFAPAERVAFWIPPRVESRQDPKKVYERFAETLQKFVPARLPQWRQPGTLLQFGPSWATARLNPTLNPHWAESWPAPARFGLADVLGGALFLGIFTIFALAIFQGQGKQLVAPLLLGRYNRLVREPAPVQTELPRERRLLGDYAAEYAKSVRELEGLASEIRVANALPTMIDHQTEWTTVTAVSGTMLIFDYRLVGARLEDRNLPRTVDAAQLRVRACQEPSTRGLLRRGIRLFYRYLDKDGRFVTVSPTVSESDCETMAAPNPSAARDPGTPTSQP